MTGFAGRAQQCWLLTAQLATLALAALALAWVGTAEQPAPARPLLVLIAVLAVANLLVALIPRLRRGEVAGILGGISFATACWFSVERTWDIPLFSVAYVPLMTPIVGGVAVALAVWGLLARVGIGGESRIGKAALLGGLLLGITSIIFYLTINFVPALQREELNYAIEIHQLQEQLVVATLYPLALWLGGVGVRSSARVVLLPLGMAGVLAAFCIFWLTR